MASDSFGFAGWTGWDSVFDLQENFTWASLQFTSVSQGRLLHVRVPFQTPLDLLCVYQYSWNTQKNFDDTHGRKVDALLKQRQTVWNHIKKWLKRTPRRNGCLLLGDFNTPLRQSGLHVGHGVIPIQGSSVRPGFFQEVAQTPGCCASERFCQLVAMQSQAPRLTLTARGRLADGKAKACSTFEAPFVPRSGCRHLPIQCSVCKPKPPMTNRE